jgi:hypothetical protein
VYSREDVAAIFRLIPDKEAEGKRIPERWDRSLIRAQWRKVDVWKALGLAPPIELLSPGTKYFRQQRVATMLGTSDGVLSEATTSGRLPAERLDDRSVLIAAATLEEWLGHPLILWPIAANDPAFTAYQSSAKETSRDEAQDASTDVLKNDPAMNELKSLIEETTNYAVGIALTQHDHHFVMLMQAAVNNGLNLMISDGTLNLRIRDETLAAMKGMVGREVHDAITNALRSGTIESILSDKDVARVADAARNAVREVAAARGPELITATPLASTTRLQDRVRGGSNGR